MKKILVFLVLLFVIVFAVVGLQAEPEEHSISYVNHSGNTFTYFVVNDPPPRS